MAPTPKNMMRKNETRRFERPAHLEKSLYMDILESQQADASGYLADTLLICGGGTIKVHAFILQAASPFFQDAIASQGENYPYIREVLLPDFPVKEIERMLTFIYKGYVDLKNDQEVKNLEETLAIFRIKGAVPFTASSGERDVGRFKGCLKVQEFKHIPQDISKASILIKTGNTPTGRNGETSGTQTARRTGGRPTAGSSDGNNKGRSKIPVDIDKSKLTEEKYQPFVKLRQLVLPPPGGQSSPGPSKISNGSATNSPANSIKSPVSKPAFVKPSFIKQSEEEDLETDEEDKDWEPPNYNDKSWMAKEALRCQACNKQYEKHGEALSCVTSKHKALRCYFCFTVYSSTEILFRHFAKRHKQAAGRDKTVMCHYCDSMVPYKSVSCHVISVHLKTRPDNPDSHVNNSPRPGRPCTVPTAPVATKTGPTSLPSKTSGRTTESQSPGNSTPAKKRIKREDTSDETTGPRTKKAKGSKVRDAPRKLQVEDLDVAVDYVTRTGKVMKFRIQKSRSTGAVMPFRIIK